MRKTLYYSFILTVLCGIFGILNINSIFAASNTKNWTGAGDGYLFSDPANWAENQVPQNGDNLIFDVNIDEYGISVFNDFPNLTIGETKIIFSDDPEWDGEGTIDFGGATIAGDIYMPPMNVSGRYFSVGNFTLGADIKISGNFWLRTYSGTFDHLSMVNLNNKTLVLESPATFSNMFIVDSGISGNGTLILQSHTSLSGLLSGSTDVGNMFQFTLVDEPYCSSYTGKTVIENAMVIAGHMEGATGCNDKVFGNSELILETGGTFVYGTDADGRGGGYAETTFLNARVRNPDYSFIFNGMDYPITLPKVTLESDTKFALTNLFSGELLGTPRPLIDLRNVDVGCFNLELIELSADETMETFVARDGSGWFFNIPERQETCDAPTHPPIDVPNTSSPDTPKTGMVPGSSSLAASALVFMAFYIPSVVVLAFVARKVYISRG